MEPAAAAPVPGEEAPDILLENIKKQFIIIREITNELKISHYGERLFIAMKRHEQ